MARYIYWYPVLDTHYRHHTCQNKMVATTNILSHKNTCAAIINYHLHHKEDQNKCRFCQYCGKTEAELQKHLTVHRLPSVVISVNA